MKLISISILVLFSYSSFGQSKMDTTHIINNKCILDANAIKIGFQTRNQLLFEFGVFKMYTTEYYMRAFNFGPSISLGIPVDSKSYAIPKAGIELHFLFFGAKTSVVHYTNFRKSQFVFLPEVGISIFGSICVMYGHNFFFDSTNHFNIGKDLFTFTFNVPIYNTRYHKYNMCK